MLRNGTLRGQGGRRFIIVRDRQIILQRVEPFYIHTINIATHLEGKLCTKPNYDDILVKDITGPRVGKILWESFGGRKKTANRGEWIGTHQRVFTRKPARGDHVGSRLHSYQSRLCSQLMTFSPHAKPSVHDPSNLGNLLFFLKLCLIEILFGVSLSVTSSLSCPEAKIVKLSIAGLSECGCGLHL